MTRITQPQYPYLLKQITQLPPHFDVSGEVPSDDYKFLCVIGSRTHSTYGKDACMKLIKGLEGYPIVIVSGLAIGIDSIAHEAALSANLKTIAFPGSGLSNDALYPASRRNLAKRIVESGGCLMSPFAMDQVGAHWTFPARNRLMAGVSHAVLIIEARQGSGTLITAEYAVQFNRDVLAVPGSIFDDLSYGPHMLIRDGATPIRSSEDILQALGFELEENHTRKLLPDNNRQLSADEQKIVDHLRFGPSSASEIIEKCSLSSSAFNIYASQLELAGMICEKNGRYRISR